MDLGTSAPVSMFITSSIAARHLALDQHGVL